MAKPWEDEQLSLFASDAPSGRGTVGPAVLSERVAELAARMPARLRMGTSSWSFPGWQGLVWNRAASPGVLARCGLPAYAEHPLLRCVGLDRTHYAPVAAPWLQRHACAVPEHFRFLIKAHEWCTLARFPMLARHGERAGRLNPVFLDPEYATREVIEPAQQGLGARLGVVLFQFPPQDPALVAGPRGFADRLARFLERLPSGPVYAIELRNRELLTRDYAAALAAGGATHCLNVWPGMPELAIQYNASGAERRSALVIRWMLRPGLDYETARREYSPFDRIVDPDPATRENVARLLARASGPSFLIVNNKAEGSSPASILAVAERVAALVGD